MKEVENILRYTFKNKPLLVQALLHKSTKEGMTLSSKQFELEDYEKLEFLGDSILNFLVA